MISQDAHPADSSDRVKQRRSGAGRNLPLAIGTAVVLAGLFFATIFTNEWAFLAFVGIIILIGTLEVTTALRGSGLRPPVWVIVTTGLAALFGAFAFGPIAQIVALAVLLFGAVLWVSANREDPRQLESLSAGLLAGLWVPFLASFIALLLRREAGNLYVLTIVVLTVANDIGAYAVGSFMGRHRLAPAISPGKTWEGLFGGLVTVLIVSGVGVPMVLPEMTVLLGLALGVLIALVASVGDLAESMVKRSLGIKDLGYILPGHGGIMDRVDALLFTLPAAHLVLLIGGI